MRLFLAFVALAAATRANALTYNLTHLNANNQEVCGPIQDDEALFLYALVRGMRMERILEIGGLGGYSARNFLAAMAESYNPKMITVDLQPVPSQAANHVVITKDATLLQPSDLDGKPLDLVFFDCHEYDVQMATYERLLSQGLITDATVIALHDTHVWPRSALQYCGVGTIHTSEGYIHQLAERRMVNKFKELGYDVLTLHTPHSRLLGPGLRMRHGVTVCTRFHSLKNAATAGAL